MLPIHVANALRNGREVSPQHYPLATVLVADIMGFNTLALKSSPQQVNA